MARLLYRLDDALHEAVDEAAGLPDCADLVIAVKNALVPWFDDWENLPLLTEDQARYVSVTVRAALGVGEPATGTSPENGSG